MTKVWNLLREKFFDHLSHEDQYKFNRINNLARSVAKREDIDAIKKQELIRPLLDMTIRLCRKVKEDPAEYQLKKRTEKRSLR